jgi:hypothetical protein
VQNAARNIAEARAKTKPAMALIVQGTELAIIN